MVFVLHASETSIGLSDRVFTSSAVYEGPDNWMVAALYWLKHPEMIEDCYPGQQLAHPQDHKVLAELLLMTLPESSDDGIVVLRNGLEALRALPKNDYTQQVYKGGVRGLGLIRNPEMISKVSSLSEWAPIVVMTLFAKCKELEAAGLENKKKSKMFAVRAVLSCASQEAKSFLRRQRDRIK